MPGKVGKYVKWITVMLAGVLIFLSYLWITVGVLGADLPKTAILRRSNADWHSRVDRISRQMDRYDELLTLLEVRDDKIYRSVYGMDEIPQAVRMRGFGREADPLTRRLDVLERRAYIQSVSFDAIASLQSSAGDMASHIPSICPMSTAKGSFHMSSPFGYRSDPLLHFRKRHTGMDFACPPGNPIYATGDGVVVKVAHERKGYGNHVVIDHGFGYKSRYAHMSRIDVVPGQKLLRGDCIGLSGRSGRITGPHLHYEILYRKDYVNPALYMDLNMSPEDYFSIVRKPEK